MLAFLHMRAPVFESHASFTVISSPLTSYCAVLGSIVLQWPPFPCALFLSTFKEISLQRNVAFLGWHALACSFLLHTCMCLNFTQNRYHTFLLSWNLHFSTDYMCQKLAHAYVLRANSFIQFFSAIICPIVSNFLFPGNYYTGIVQILDYYN